MVFLSDIVTLTDSSAQAMLSPRMAAARRGRRAPV